MCHPPLLRSSSKRGKLASPMPLYRPWRSILASLYYIATSTSLTVLNKLLFLAPSPLAPATLLFYQSLTTLVSLTLLSHLSPSAYSSPPLPPLRLYLPLLVSHLLTLTTSLFSLRLTSLLMYNTIRRTSILPLLLLSSLTSRPTLPTLTAAFLTTTGALIAARHDSAPTPLGYILALAANISTSLYLILLRPTKTRLQLSSAQLIHLNAAFSAPLLFALHLSSAPAPATMNAPLIAASCVGALVISHATAVSTGVNDAVAHSLGAQVKDVVLLVVSFLLAEGGEKRDRRNVAGVLLGFCGSLVYACGKVLEGWGGGKGAKKAGEEKARKKVEMNGDRVTTRDKSE